MKSFSRFMVMCVGFRYIFFAFWKTAPFLASSWKWVKNNTFVFERVGVVALYTHSGVQSCYLSEWRVKL
jgi:hypothetical protein